MAAVRAHGTMTGDTFAASQAGAFSTLPPEQRTDITTFLASPVAPMPGQGPTTPHTRTVAELSAEEKLSKAFEYAKGRRDAAWDAAELASHRRWVGSSGSAGERLAIGPLRYETLTSPARLYGGARLIRAELVNVQLASADLSEVDLLEAVLRNVILRRAKLRNARLGGTYMLHCDLSGALMDGADLAKAQLAMSTFRARRCVQRTLCGWKPPTRPLRKPTSRELTSRTHSSPSRI